MGRKELFIYGILLVLALGFAIAENETNSTDTNQTQQNNTNITNSTQNETNSTNNQTNPTVCEEDEDCASGYECEDDICVLDDEDDDDSNETDSDDNETDEDEEKVCCYRYRMRNGNITDSQYEFKEREDCLESNNSQKYSEVVNNSMCRQGEQNKERQRIHFEEKTGVECPDECTCTGAVMKCEMEGGREMRVYSGSGNIIIQIKGVNMSTNVTLYKDENGTLYGNFSGVEKKIKFMPDEAKAKFKEKIKSKWSEEETEIELEDNGNYKIKTQKEARLLWVFKVREGVNAEINSENGELVQIKNKWWGFLANDVEED